MLESAARDLALAARQLRRSPLFAASVILTLALGLGANATLFALADAVLFRPFGFADPDRLVIGGESVMATRSEISYPTFRDWQERARRFDGLAAMGSSDWTVTLGGDDPVKVAHRAVSGEFFAVLGAGAALGRTFEPGDDRPGAGRVVVVSHALWQRRFGADPEIVGRSIRLDGDLFTIVGVMPRNFGYPSGTEAWSPLVPVLAGIRRPELPDFLQSRDAAMLHVVGRLEDGAALDAARSDLDRVVRELAAEQGRRDGVAARLVPLLDDLVGPSRTTLGALLGAVALLLVAASANVAGLMLVQASRRRHEFAIRAALGASRGAVARQLFCEILLLASLAALAAVVIARASLPVVLALAPPEVPRLDQAAIDGRVAAFTLLIAFASAVLCWIVPALSLDRTGLDAALRGGARAVAAGGFGRPGRRWLVALEIAVAIVILTFSGLLYRSVSRLGQLDLGFRPDGLLAIEVDRPESLAGADNAAVDRFGEELIAAIAAVPGVEAVGAAGGRPLKGPIGLDSSWRVEGQDADVAARNPWVNTEPVTPSYFAAMGTPLRRGRLFDDGDRETTQPVVIVNEKLAEWAWPGQSPLGKRISVAALEEGWWTVVGVVADVRYREIQSAPLDVYVSYRQSAFPAGDLMVRTRGQPGEVAPALRERLQAVNPAGAVGIVAMDEVVAAHQAPWRANLAFFAMFAGLTAVLAVVGLYGLLAGIVAEQTREIAVRLALGATGRQIVGGVLLEGARIAIAGAAAGMAGAVGGARLIGALLFEVSPLDGVTLAAAPLLLLAIGAVAAAVPAVRAARVDPAASLRDA